MNKMMKKRIGIIGGGPAGLFAYKRLTDQSQERFGSTVFEAGDTWATVCPMGQKALTASM